ncbi:hypothetical protein ABT364_12960 [Massilia sp. SR12]
MREGRQPLLAWRVSDSVGTAAALAAYAGPNAPSLYAASYPGVLGVSGVDPKRHPLPEAARGPQVMFAPPGSQMAAAPNGCPPHKPVRGTSLAPPLVAALLAPGLPSPAPGQAARTLAALATGAVGGRIGWRIGRRHGGNAERNVRRHQRSRNARHPAQPRCRCRQQRWRGPWPERPNRQKRRR